MRNMIYIGMILLLVVACTPAQLPEEKTPEQIKVDLEKGTYIEKGAGFTFDLNARNFASEKELKDFLSRNAGYYGGYYRGGVAMDMAMVESSVKSVAPMAAGESDGGYGLDYSNTNNQVAGVDEADILKSDGKYIYTITGNVLYIVEAYPGEEAKVISTIDLKESSPSGIFVEKDRLAVFGNFYNYDSLKEYGFTPRTGMTFLDIYDISDRKEPKLDKEFRFEGSYLDARLNGGDIYFIVVDYQGYRAEPLPMIIDGGVVRKMALDSIYYFGIPYSNPQLATVHSVDLASGRNTDSKSIFVEGGVTLYMSNDNIYLAYTEYLNEWDIQKEISMELLEPYLTMEDKVLIQKIKDTDNDVLNQYEKENKIYQIYSAYVGYMSSDEMDAYEDELQEELEKRLDAIEHFEYTILNKLTVDGGDIRISANGKVPGHIINQFAMDEFKGDLRIATSLSQRWSMYGKERSESTNNVYALDSGLKVIGELEGLAEGETIYSARFMGERLYMVTFKQIDPFFVIDLSDPKRPKNMGELKIPGYSTYLHPYDENTIIGIGIDASSSGRTRGLKISLFDVKDVSSPKEIAKWVSDERYASSNALYEHKAFLFDRTKELMVIPVYSYDYSGWERGGESYNGAFVFSVKKDEIELRGLIDHSNGQVMYQPQVERSLYIENLLYTKSPNLLRINDLEDLHSVKNVTLSKVTSSIKVY